MRVSVCLGAILIPEYLEFILAILLPGAECIPEYILIPEYSQTNAPLESFWKRGTRKLGNDLFKNALLSNRKDVIELRTCKEIYILKACGMTDRSKNLEDFFLF